MNPASKGQCRQGLGSTISQKHCNTLRYYGNINLYFLQICKAQKQGKVTEELGYKPLPPQKAPHKHTNSLYAVWVNTALPQQLLVNRLRIGTGTAKRPSKTPLQSSIKLTRNIGNAASALIRFKKRKFTLVLFIIPTVSLLSNSCHFLSQIQLLSVVTKRIAVSSHALEIRDAY